MKIRQVQTSSFLLTSPLILQLDELQLDLELELDELDN
jgi:hypothetical protein